VSEEQPERIPRPAQSVGGVYTQVNILFPSEQVELPDAEKFKAFPPEAQKAILVAFEREQIERHSWLKNQQANEHKFNIQSERHYFCWKMAGVFGGLILAVTALLTGAWLVRHGASIIGTAIMMAAIAGLVGTAIYGHKAKEGQKAEDNAHENTSN
jgi:hypothetical protein